MLLSPDVLIATVTSIFLFLALCGVLVLIVVSMRRPTTLPLLIATGILILALIVVAVSPTNVPTIVGIILALLGVTIGVLGGNPVTRRVLEIATHGRVHETEDGGIIVGAAEPGSPEPGTTAVLRGGTTIGYLERLGTVVALVAGFPEALAVIVAIKGVGRFSELAGAEARERFIIGTLASLLWACAAGALIRLAIW
ncbi:hypothetical protein [Microbacterium terricola]|uniref:Uncharacterized protein n=1 Tax=Microbacterium terricola TaxID=344163 RepID=A0ABM8DXR6_9MICO|nr:hypothetical protein [Microbacterium terricola]UYK38994.1 hypothetical protein OAU46_09795 [Microbacterium terricola]BDV30300.1 hypothetical protein Microterr_09600 [Microbacterium terricola]